MRRALQLENWSALYLGLPLLIFVLTWLKPLYALALTASLAYLLWNHFNNPIDQKGTEIEWKFFGILFLLAFVWVFFSGIGGFTYQNGDWKKHFSILYALINQTWPISYADPSSPTGEAHLVYYLGYYIIPSLFGKLTSWDAMTAFLMPYTAFGVALGFYWLRILTGVKSLVLVFLFTWTSGLDLIGWLIMEGHWPGYQQHIEWWSDTHMQYAATTNLLFWVPQHALAAWIGVPFLLKSLQKENWLMAAICIVSLPIWSPFVCVGVAPFVVYLLYKNRSSWPSYLLPGTVITLFAGLFYLYYSSSIGSLGLISSLNRLQNSHYVTGFFLFHILEYLVFFALIYWCWSKEVWREHKAFFVLALVMLMLIPLRESRMWNDWVMRTSIPALYLMWVWLLQAMFKLERRSLKYSVIGFLLIVGSVTAFKEYERSMEWFQAERRDLYPAEVMTKEFFKPKYKIQYFSDGDGIFHRFIASQNE